MMVCMQSVRKGMFTALLAGLFLLSASIHRAKAQTLEWNIHAFGYVDNREYAASDLYSQTILGMQFAPEAGVLIDSVHRLRFGINLTKDFGSPSFGDQARALIYYQYQNKGIDFYLGSFSREQTVGLFPRALLNDTLLYQRPTVEGLYLKVNRRLFRQEAWVDWVRRQSAEDREEFLAGLSGRLGKDIFHFKHNLSLYHKAKSSLGDEPIRDNLALTAALGTSLGGKTFLDSLDLSAGILLSNDRLRGEYEFRSAKGAIIDLYAAYRSWFLHNVFYSGEEHAIPYGDRFYGFDTYNRLDLGWRPFRKGPVEGFFMFSLHFSPGAISNQQMIQLRYSLGRTHRLR